MVKCNRLYSIRTLADMFLDWRADLNRETGSAEALAQATPERRPRASASG